ncbi:MAG: hypothetical protein CRN43_18560 [Candidatus Nephrothrix sp. EaCA]|nr:MAG: hypothetical protein CRN43_18560 [Candidatus Nephrothrix sp. EaCA]
MNKLSLYRIILLLGGTTALMVIVFAQPIKVHKPAEKAHVCISAPSDILPGSAVEMTPETLGFSLERAKEFRAAFTDAEPAVSNFFQTLFRTLIVSQAP